LVCRFFPKPDLFVLLDNRAEVIHARKEDLSVEQIERFRESYRKAICKHPHEIVTTDRSPEEISDHILERMLRLSVSK
jgi:thymidylate kinase